MDRTDSKIDARLTPSDSRPVRYEDADPELRYATRLAQYLWEKHWKEASPDWKPLPDLMGVLTQIDNMVANLHPKKSLAD